jgi:hypothetical protein
MERQRLAEETPGELEVRQEGEVMSNHKTKVIEVLQVADGIVSVCISCCDLHGEWNPCVNCGGCPDGCLNCLKTALEPHPSGGQFPVVRPGYVKDPDTRSWNTFHIVAQEPTGPRVRTTDELQKFLDDQHERIASQHEAANQAIKHANSLVGQEVKH